MSDDHSSATILVYGDVMAADFPLWIARHAAKLGLGAVTSTARDGCLQIRVTGGAEMLQALAIGCSLGSASVMVDRVDFASNPTPINK